MEDYIGIGDASKFLGVSEKTLHLWDQNGRLVANKTEGGHRHYDSKTLRNFIRNNDVDRPTYDKMKTTGKYQCAFMNSSDELMNYWKGFGVHDTALAYMLTNQMDHCASSNECDGVTEGFIISLMKTFWIILSCRRWVDVSCLHQPTGVHYYLEKNGESPTFHQQDMVAQHRKYEEDFLAPGKAKQKTATMLDEQYNLTTSIPIANNLRHLSEPYLAEENAQRMASSVSREVFEDLESHAKPDRRPIEEIACDYEFVVTNNVGAKIIARNEVKSGIKVYTSGPKDCFLFGNYAKGLDSWYTYYFHTPMVIGPNKFENDFITSSMSRRGTRFIRPGIEKQFAKSYF